MLAYATFNSTFSVAIRLQPVPKMALKEKGNTCDQ